LKSNELFDQQLLKLPRYYDIRSLQKKASLGQERERVSAMPWELGVLILNVEI
jgi:hypothetical protein